jgi:methionyl aminopeptidase
MSISSPADLEGIRRVGRIVAAALEAMRSAVAPGVTTAALDAIGETVLERHGARSAPRLVYGFPGCTCISLNDEIVHGIPGDRVIAPGDVVKLDVTSECDGYFADAADTVLVPPVSAAARRLRSSVVAAFQAGLDAAESGALVNEIGRAVERRVHHDGFAVIRELCGHGVGRTIHEPPEVANYYVASQRDRLTDGLVLTIEPMLAARHTRVVQQHDGWTISTGDGCLSVHYEHTLIITPHGPEIVTAGPAHGSSPATV